MKTIHLNKQTGSSLVVVLSVLATLMVIVGIAAEYTSTVNRHVRRSNTLQSAVVVGDSCIELLFSNWRKICSTAPRTQQTTNDFNGTNGPAIPTPAPSQLNLSSVTNPLVQRGTSFDPGDEYSPDFTISNYKIVAVTPEWTALSSAGASPIPMLGQVAGPVSSIAPTTPLVYNYIASADVTLPALGPTGNRTVVAKVRRVFQKQQLSPWNFAIFYVDPLEIHPGPPFTVTGWVHTNSDLYTGHNTLTFADKVTYGSDWFVNFMTPAANPRIPAPGDTTHPETPSAPYYPGNLPPARDQALQPFGLDSASLFNTTDPNPNNDSYRELIEPPTASPDPLSNSRYWDQADVIIQIDNSNNVTIGKPHFNASGVADGIITPLNGPTPSARDTALYNMFNTPGAIIPGPTPGIQDNREGGTIRLATIDLSKIQANTSGLNPYFKANATNRYFNGIVYIYDNSATTHSLNPDGSVNQNPTSPVRRGIRLLNGSKIAITGLTIVSPNPVYIQGDYNTGRDYGTAPITTPPSNNTISDPTTPQVVGYNNPSNPSGPGVRAPCSILADAVTILSNSWNDVNAGTTPVASNTTVNTAILAGIVPSNAYGDGAYSGGAENFPRFLEAWDTKKLTYYGSMVELYKSQQSIAKWQYGGVYGAPGRQWYFDTNFKITPPPGSLMLYSYIKGKWSVL
jgi:hypothetical protein